MKRLAARRRRDERGAVLVMSVAGVILSMIAGALAIDLGFVAREARENQKIADLTALTGAQWLSTTEAVAKATAVAADNGMRSDGTLTIQCAPTVAGPFVTCAAGHGVIKVTVSSQHESKMPFVGDVGNVTRDAVASIKAAAGFAIGSGVASIDPTKALILNGALADMLGTTAFAFNFGHYNGLVNGSLTLDAIRQEFATFSGSAITAEEFLDMEMTAAELYKATGNALAHRNPPQPGDTANAAIFCSSSAVGPSSPCGITSLGFKANAPGTFTLRDMLTVASGSEDAALASEFNLLRLATGSAAVANEDNGVAIPAITLGIPLVGNVTGTLHITEKPRTYIGPAGPATGTPHVTTSQIGLNLSVNLVGLGLLSVSVSAGAANGWLTEARCTLPRRTIVHATTNPAGVTARLGVLPIAVTANANGGVGDPQFLYPLYPDASHPAMASVGGPATLSLAASGLSLGQLLAGTVINALGSAVIQPVLDSLGLTLGTADVFGLDPLDCANPTLLS